MKKEDDGSIREMAAGSFLGALIGLALTLALMLLAAALISGEKLPENLAETAIICSAFIGASVGSVIAAKRHGRAVLISGLMTGGAYLVMVLALTAFGGAGHSFGVLTLKLAICALIGGIFGGTICLKQGRGRRARR